VPHAGRYYAPSVIADAAVPLSRLRLLEDRYADLLITRAVERGATAFVAEHARAFMDLNRDPREIDPALIAGAPPHRLISSIRTRHGLGLIPSRIGDSGRLWRRKLAIEEIEARIEAFHAPYHEAIANALAVARTQFGVALLLDCHSMPSLRQDHHTPPPTIVVGDRFGRSASAAFSDLVETVARQTGFIVGRNAPYAGGFSLDLHGRPHLGIHALQIEIDRNQYLDKGLDQPGDGLERVGGLIAEVFERLAAELRAPPALAAE
jgi:N-formylglutamate amidohydrolase